MAEKHIHGLAGLEGPSDFHDRITLTERPGHIELRVGPSKCRLTADEATYLMHRLGDLADRVTDQSAEDI